MNAGLARTRRPPLPVRSGRLRAARCADRLDRQCSIGSAATSRPAPTRCYRAPRRSISARSNSSPPRWARVNRVMGPTFIAARRSRVNLIGDHTDYTGGLVLPMAIDRWTEIAARASDSAHLESDVGRRRASRRGSIRRSRAGPGRACVGPLRRRRRRRDGPGGPWCARPCDDDDPGRCRTVIECRTRTRGGVRPRIPGMLRDLARLCQRTTAGERSAVRDHGPARHRRRRRGHALAIDCHTLDIVPVAILTAWM